MKLSAPDLLQEDIQQLEAETIIMYCKAFLFILLSLTSTESTSANPANNEDVINPKIELFTGTYFEPVKNMIPYHSSIPIVYEIPIYHNITLPKLSPLSNNSCTTSRLNYSKSYCQIQDYLIDLQNKIHDQINAEEELFKNPQPEKRIKRSLSFIGDFFSWCCGIANQHEIHDLVENEEELKKHSNDLTDLVTIEHKDLKLTTDNLNNFTQNIKGLTDKVHYALRTMQNEINTFTKSNTENNQLFFTQQSWTYQYINYYHDNLRYVKLSCKSNTLSETIIPQTTLLQDLQKISSTAQKFNLIPAIPLQRINLYYKLPITTCFQTKDSIIIRTQIPLQKFNTSYNIYRNIPTPLHWENKLCYISKEKSIVVTTKTFTQAIHQNDPACNSNTWPLCLLPRETISADGNHRCLQRILQGSSLSDLRSTCNFVCEPESELPVITRLLPNKFLITNIKQNLTLNCPKKSFDLAFTSSGTLEIHLPCNCSISENSSRTILIQEIYPCDVNDIKDSKITHLIPFSWSKFNTLTIFPITSDVRHQFDHLEEVLNSDWKFSSQTYYVHTIVKQEALEHVNLKHDEKDLFNNTELLMYIFLAWCILLTLIILIVIYCLHIQHIQLKLLKPQTVIRDYPLPALPRNSE